MAGVAILAADGFETIECLTVLDVLRRGGVRATLVSIMDTREVVSAQQVSVTCDEVRHVAAICAAPSILAELGLLEGRRATCFPGFEGDFPEGSHAGSKTVVVDGNIITASAMGQALPFALALLGDIAGERAVEKVKDGIQL